jgi:hypothetical protein
MAAASLSTIIGEVQQGTPNATICAQLQYCGGYVPSSAVTSLISFQLGHHQRHRCYPHW